VKIRLKSGEKSKSGEGQIKFISRSSQSQVKEMSRLGQSQY